MTPNDIATVRLLIEVHDREGNCPVYDARPLIAASRIGLRVVDPSPEDVERVARALCAAAVPRCDPDAPLSDDEDKPSWFAWEKDARAALKAIAEDGE